MKTDWRIKKVEREANRHGLSATDLKYAVNAVICSRCGDTFEAEGWEGGIDDDHRDLWIIAHDVVDFMEDLGGEGVIR